MSNFLGGGGGGAVSSVFGRTGAVVATEADYSLSQLSNVTGTSGSGSTVLLSTITAAATGDILSFSGGNWVNSYVGLDTNPQAGAAYAVVTGDKDKLVLRTHTTTMADTIAQAGTAGFPDQWTTRIRNDDTLDAYALTATTSKICTDAGCGSSVLTLGPGDEVRLSSNGTDYIATVTYSLSQFGFMLGADNGPALVVGDDQPSIWVNLTGRTITIVKVWIEADVVAAGTSFNLQRDDGTPANILTADLTANTTGQTACASGCTTTLTAEATVADGDRIDLLVVLASTAKRATIWVVYR